MNKVFLVLFLACLTFSAKSQSYNDYFKIEMGYLSGIGNIKYTDQISVSNVSNAFRLRISYGFFVNPKTSIGIGAGLDGYAGPTYNTMPIFIEGIREIKIRKFKPIIFANIGHSIAPDITFEKGTLLAIGTGIPLRRKKITWLPSLGFNAQSIKNADLIYYDQNSKQLKNISSDIVIKSLVFNLALSF